MSIIAWIVLGLIAGFIGSKLVNKTGEGFFLDIGLGIVGAVIGGWLFNLFGMRGVTGLNVYSLIVAVIGAVVFLVVYHAIRRTHCVIPTRTFYTTGMGHSPTSATGTGWERTPWHATQRAAWEALRQANRDG